MAIRMLGPVVFLSVRRVMIFKKLSSMMSFLFHGPL